MILKNACHAGLFSAECPCTLMRGRIDRCPAGIVGSYAYTPVPWYCAYIVVRSLCASGAKEATTLQAGDMASPVDYVTLPLASES